MYELLLWKCVPDRKIHWEKVWQIKEKQRENSVYFVLQQKNGESWSFVWRVTTMIWLQLYHRVTVLTSGKWIFLWLQQRRWGPQTPTSGSIHLVSGNTHTRTHTHCTKSHGRVSTTASLWQAPPLGGAIGQQYNLLHEHQVYSISIKIRKCRNSLGTFLWSCV